MLCPINLNLSLSHQSYIVGIVWDGRNFYSQTKNLEEKSFQLLNLMSDSLLRQKAIFLDKIINITQ